MRSGDLDIYAMNADGSGAKRLTFDKGYDGGPFFSWDGKTIVYTRQSGSSPVEICKVTSAGGLCQLPSLAGMAKCAASMGAEVLNET